jgi:hypothetical protein
MMLKWKRIRPVVLLATVILSISSIFVYVSLQKNASDHSIPNFSSVPPDYFAPIGSRGQVVSLAEAQASVPFKIQLPTYTGGRDSFVQIILFPITEKNSYSVGIILASEWIPSSASRPDVREYYNGILLTEMSVSDAWGTLQDADGNMKAFLAESMTHQEVSINGYFGTAGGNVAHGVQWATETTYYCLEAGLNCPLSELIEIAQSIPLK